MKILLTGGSGFIGKRLITRWKSQHEIFAFGRKPDPQTSRDITVIPADLTQPIDRQSLPARVDVIIHLAQGRAGFPEGASELFSINTAATQQLLDYGRSAGIRRFIFTSSGDVYGTRREPCKEDDPLQPDNFYGVTKFCSEQLVRSYENYFPFSILRLFHPYGPEQSGRLIPKMAERIQQKKPVQLSRNHSPYFSPIYIDDVLAFMEDCLAAGDSHTTNLAGERISLHDLAEEIGKVVGVSPVFEQKDQEGIEISGVNTLMKKRRRSNRPLVGIREGLQKTFLSEGVLNA